MEDQEIVENKDAKFRVENYTEEELKILNNRLNRVEGQIHGIRKMIEKNTYSTDILIQISAATAAMNSLAKVLISEHIKNSLAKDVQEGNFESIDEFVGMLQKLLK